MTLADYEFHLPLVASHAPDAGWFVAVAVGDGIPDAEAICAFQDAVEAPRHILLVSNDRRAFERASAALLRIVEAAPAPRATVH